MARKKAEVEDRVDRAARLCIDCPKLTVPKAMLAERFTLEESQDKCQQMRVRRHIETLQKSDDSSVPAVVDVNVGDLSSPLTHSTGVASKSTLSCESSEATRSTASTKRSGKKAVAKAAGAKLIRASSSQAQQPRVNKKKIKSLNSKAFKEATKTYNVEKNKSNGMSTRAVCENVNAKYGTAVNKRTVQQYVKEGMVGVSPLKMGPDGGIPKEDFDLLAGAFESFVRINQANATDAYENTRRNLQHLVNTCVNSKFLDKESRNSHNLLNRLLRECAIDLNASVDVSVEERRIR